MVDRNGEQPTRFQAIASNKPYLTSLAFPDSVRGDSPSRRVLSSSIVDRVGPDMALINSHYRHVEDIPRKPAKTWRVCQDVCFPSLHPNVHTRTYTHTHTRKYSYTHARSHIHALKKHAPSHTGKHTHKRTNTHTHRHTYTLTHTYPHTHR